jgi:hypothetical protein
MAAMATATAAAAAIIIQKEREAGLSIPEELCCSFRAEVVEPEDPEDEDEEDEEECPSDPQRSSVEPLLLP